MINYNSRKMKALLITFLFFCFSFNKLYCLEINMNKIDLNTYIWNKRLLTINSSSIDKENLNHINNWLDSNKCEIEERNISIVLFTDYKSTQYKRPLFLEKFGFWLIGYDGEIKASSVELSFLNEIFSLIDQMPIRQQEMLMHKTKC